MAPQLPYYVLEGGRETVGRLSRYFIHMGSIRSEGWGFESLRARQASSQARTPNRFNQPVHMG